MKECNFSRDFVPPVDIDDPPIYITKKPNPTFPEMIAALEWHRSATAGGRLTRKAFRPGSLGKLLFHASLFDIIKDDDGRAADLRTRVFASAMARIYGEIGGALTSAKLPDKVNRRFLFHVNSMMEAGDIVLSRTQVAFGDKSYLSGEGLVIPIWKDDAIHQCLNFFCFR